MSSKMHIPYIIKTVDQNMIPALEANFRALEIAVKGTDKTLTEHDHDTDYASTIHDLIDTTNHPVTGQTIGNVLMASSATAYGFSPVHTFKNKIINGNLDLWQRGTTGASLTGSWASEYLADRWRLGVNKSTAQQSRQSFTVGQTDVPGEPTYFHRTVVTSAEAAECMAYFQQPIESVRSCAGQTVTVSFWAKADASKWLDVQFMQRFGSGGTPSNSVQITSQEVTLSTAWQKFSLTFNIPSITGKTLGTTHDGSLQLEFIMDNGYIPAYQSGTFDIAQVQVELGSVATAFEQRPIGLELSLCQRYYTKHTTNAYPGFYYADANDEYMHAYQVSFPCSMRIVPTVAVTGATYNSCTHRDLRPSLTDLIHRVDKSTSTGRYRVAGATYTANAEL